MRILSWGGGCGHKGSAGLFGGDGSARESCQVSCVKFKATGSIRIRIRMRMRKSAKMAHGRWQMADGRWEMGL